jgi:Lactate racemase N-terminal domain
MRVPLLSGTRLLVVNAPDDAIVLAPPEPPAQAITDVGAAVRDALRFPLAGAQLSAMVHRGARATIVTDVPALPLPSAPVDARRAAIGAAVQELRNLGVPDEKQTILVTAGLARRPGRRDLDRLFAPAFARAFQGSVKVHDVEDPNLAELGTRDGLPLRIAKEILDADVVLVVSAAETVLNGGAAVLAAAGGPDALRASGAQSLLEPSGSSGWEIALVVERELARHVALTGVSLTLDHPRIADTAFGYPYDPLAGERIARSWAARGFRWVPGPLRLRMIRSLPIALTAAAAFAGPPSVAHAEALLRAIDLRSVDLDRPLDALCVGIPRTTPHLPRERPNPLLAAYLGLGLALRLWREQPSVVEGGTAILVHRFHRRFAHPTQQPYRAFFNATRGGLDPELIGHAETMAASDERALARYRGGRECHPRLPFADWSAIAPQAARLGSVIVAGCRDAGAARQLGFVPSQSVGTALDLALGRADASARVGFLLSPPYFPLRVGA